MQRHAPGLLLVAALAACGSSPATDPEPPGAEIEQPPVPDSSDFGGHAAAETDAPEMDAPGAPIPDGDDEELPGPPEPDVPDIPSPPALERTGPSDFVPTLVAMNTVGGQLIFHEVVHDQTGSGVVTLPAGAFRVCDSGCDGQTGEFVLAVVDWNGAAGPGAFRYDLTISK